MYCYFDTRKVIILMRHYSLKYHGAELLQNFQRLVGSVVIMSLLCGVIDVFDRRQQEKRHVPSSNFYCLQKVVIKKYVYL